MKTNEELQKDVQDAIKWEPLLNAAEIGVIVKDGIVTLTGTVDSYEKKREAENAAKELIGVKAVVENIEVKIPNAWSKTDEEIAKDVLNALKSRSTIPDENIMVKVENGFVTLTGEVPWHYQKEAAGNVVRFLNGVKNLFNNIKIKSEANDVLEKRDIERALRRSSVDDSDIDVSVLGTTVTLTGTVPSWKQKEEAGKIAWKTPGIWKVKNDLEVDFDFYL